MATDFELNPITGKLDLIMAAETFAHADLTDMPDSGGTNTDHDARYARLTNATQLITAGDFRNVGDVTVAYSGDFVSKITVNGREVDFTNNGTDYTKWEDSDHEWTPTYTDGKLTEIEVTTK